MGMMDLKLQAVSNRLQRMLRALRDGGRLHVRPSEGHLTIETNDAEGARVILARAEPDKEHQWRLLILKSPGHWDLVASPGTLEQIADAVMDLVHPRFERAEFAIRPRDVRPARKEGRARPPGRRPPTLWPSEA